MGGSVISLYSEVKTTPVKWLWYPFIAVGKISLLQGDPGDGKSTMMLRLIAEISKGGNTPDGKPLADHNVYFTSVLKMVLPIRSNQDL